MQNITHKMCESMSIFRYLCPSLLSGKDIHDELITKYFKIKGLDKKSRDELTEIFVKHLLPLPQRIFPDNHHGKLINKMIQRENNFCRRKEVVDEKKSSLQYGFHDKKRESKQHSTQPRVVSSSGDRLKPPIDSSNVSCRKISLSKQTSASGSSLDRVMIKDQFKDRKESSNLPDARQSKTTDVTDSKNLKRGLSIPLDAEDASSNKRQDKRLPGLKCITKNCHMNLCLEMYYYLS